MDTMPVPMLTENHLRALVQQHIGWQETYPGVKCRITLLQPWLCWLVSGGSGGWSEGLTALESSLHLGLVIIVYRQHIAILEMEHATEDIHGIRQER